MILIADCGSTKIDWCLLNENKVEKQVFTLGVNAVMLTEEEIRQRFAEQLMPELADYAAKVEAVYFYGAGCIAPEVCGNVARAIRSNIPSASTIEVYTDLLAAARALCGHKPGIACIMGTGSNSCLYDGNSIVANVSPLGFILGDEGSGAVLGRLFLGDVLKKQMPPEICARFLDEYDLDLLGIIKRVYKEPQPNRFLASVTPFLSKNIAVPEIHELVLNSFRAFFRRNIKQYEAYTRLKVNFIGSIAFHFRTVLEEAAAAEGCTIGDIVKSPMEGLIRYHTL
ncbi:MAG: ATPase [Muribaculaceae bacterium]|nr:ATPase [Muribaculaceae bacterium]